MILTIATILSGYYLHKLCKKDFRQLRAVSKSFFNTWYGPIRFSVIFNKSVFYVPYVPLQFYKAKGNQP